MRAREVKDSLKGHTELISIYKFLMIVIVAWMAVSVGAASRDTMTEPEWDSQDEV